MPSVFHGVGLPVGRGVGCIRGVIDLRVHPVIVTSSMIASSTIHHLLFRTNSSVSSLVALYRTSVASGGVRHGGHFLGGFRLMHRGLGSLRRHSHVHGFRPPIDNRRVVGAFNLSPYRRMNTLGDTVGSTVLSNVVPGRCRTTHTFVLRQTRGVKLGRL